MAPTKFYCSKCQAPLKLPPGLRAGAKPKCPHCGTLIAASAQVTSLATTGRTTAVAQGSPPGPPTAALAGGTYVQPSQPRGISVGAMVAIGLVAIGGLLAVVLTVVLLLICFGGESPAPVANTPTPNIEDDVPPAPAVSSPKKLVKQTTPPSKSLIVVTAEDEAKANDAVQRGIAFLKRTQQKDGRDAGTWQITPSGNVGKVGVTSLVGLTLLESKVAANDAAVQLAASYVRAHIHQLQEHENYALTTTILFLVYLEDPADKTLIESLALRLVAGQLPSGGWNYGSGTLTGLQEAKLRAMLRDFPRHAGQGVDPMFGNLSLGVFHPAKDKQHFNAPNDSTDNSNTQFAVLALWAARKHFPGNELDPSLQLVAKRFRNSQEPDGTWTYQTNRHASNYPTMTAAGLLGLAAGYGLEGDKKAPQNMAKDDVLQKGLKALATKVGNPGQPMFDPPEMYFLWSVERVAILFQLARIDGKDWYHWGLEVLLAHQQKDGKWDTKRGPGQSDIVDTCFALLFLQRANLAKDLTDKIQALAAALGQAERKN